MLRKVSVALNVLATAAGCGRESESAPRQRSPADTVASFDQILDEFRCVEITGEGTMIAPLRGLAARKGMSCPIDGRHAHVFERAAAENVSTADAGTFREGGSIGRIDFVTGGGTSTPGCGVVLVVTDTFFVITPSDVNLERLRSFIGAPVREEVPASPTVSYLDQQCDVR